MWPAIGDCWLLGGWPTHEVRTAHTGFRKVAVIGPCGAPAGEVARLATHGVPDDVVWRWPGSYVVIQVTTGGTTLWTDLGGAWPLYTLATDGGIYWASSSRALAALTGHRLDEHRLAMSFLAPAVPALTGGRSAFADILLVPAAHRAHLATGRVELKRVWYVQPRTADHAAALRRELSAAVAVRVDPVSVPTADLSGGYDSTTLTLLAAEQLSPDRAVIGVTVHPEGVTEGGDLTYARHTAEHQPAIDHRLLPLTAEQVPYSALGAVPVTDEPAPSTIAHARFSAQLRWMHDELGSDCHLTGDGGDGLFTAPAAMLADLIAHSRYRRALSEAIAWARLRRMAVWPLLRDAIHTARTGRADALHGWACTLIADMPHRASRPRAGGTAWLPVAPPPGWATRRARNLAAEVAAEVVVPDARGPGDVDTAGLIAEVMAMVGRTARADVQLANWHGIALHNPFADSRVIDTCLAVPLDARPGPARFKPILREAMLDLFPPMLAARTTKGTFTSDYYGGMRANLASLFILANGRLAAASLVDPAGVRQALTLAAAGVPDAFTAVQHVIATETWLRALDAATPVAWEPVPGGQLAPERDGAA